MISDDLEGGRGPQIMFARRDPVVYGQSLQLHRGPTSLGGGQKPRAATDEAPLAVLKLLKRVAEALKTRRVCQETYWGARLVEGCGHGDVRSSRTLSNAAWCSGSH
jgi:hypothetical protein